MSSAERPIERDLIESAMSVEIKVFQIEKRETTAPDWLVRIDGRIGDEEDDDVEFAGMGFIYGIGVLSFADARPRGASAARYVATDAWTATDMLRFFRYEQGELRFYADYVRGRCVKTEVCVRKDGTFTLTTMNRGEAATRWIARLQGKRVLASVADLASVEG
jgi:hypothetical protein